MVYRCPYCNWVGNSPDSAEAESLEEYIVAADEFADDQENHDCSKY